MTCRPSSCPERSRLEQVAGDQRAASQRADEGEDGESRRQQHSRQPRARVPGRDVESEGEVRIQNAHEVGGQGEDQTEACEARQTDGDEEQQEDDRDDGMIRVDAALDDERSILYTSRVDKALYAVHTGKCPIALILNPTRLDQMQEVSDAGLIMPRKSTYFYPKVMTGLVINKIDGGDVS